MNKKKFTFSFKGGEITVYAFTYEEGKILAQAEAINRAWDYEIITKEQISRKECVHYESQLECLRECEQQYNEGMWC
jgi:hypothetical protein